MAQLFEFAGYCLLAWLGALALLIAFRILGGEISLNGILSTAGKRIDPERVQSLLVSLFVFGAFIIEATQSTNPHSLPDIPQSLLILIAGSNGIYLSGKMVRSQTAAPSRKPPRSQGRHKPKPSPTTSPRTSRVTQGRKQ